MSSESLSTQPTLAPRHTRRLLWALLAVIVLALIAVGGFSLFEARRDAQASRSSLVLGGPSPSGMGSLIANPHPLTDFTLTDGNGQPLALSALRGKPTLLFFGFTQCPDFCPTTLAEFKGAKRALGADADKLHVVFISVDPDRDTNAVIKRYLAAFDPSFIGLRSDDATLGRIAADYDLTYRKVPLPSGGYTVDHTATAFLIDAQGQLRVVYPYGTPASALAKDTRTFFAP
jgi:protein SCO1/2